MSIDQCVAHAIHADLDVIEAYPTVVDLDMEEIEEKVEAYVLSLQSTLSHAVSFCRQYLEGRDAEGLGDALLSFKIPLPAPMLRKMCKTMIKWYAVDVNELETLDGKPVYVMRIVVDMA